MLKNNFFATTYGMIFTGFLIGLGALILQHFGNPGNMGICVVCFERDTAGAIGLHSASSVQYLRPELIGFVLGSFLAALIFKEFKPRGGSAPLIRFILGIIAAIGALVFLGCPWRLILRLAGGDFNAILGLLGLASGIYLGSLCFKNGYSLGRSTSQSTASGFIFPILLIGLLALYFFFPQIDGEGKNIILRYSTAGPGSQHAPMLISLTVALVVGFIAQRSRFCTMGAFRDLFLFKHTHLLLGVLALFLTIFIGNYFFGNLKLGFEDQPIAHTDSLWNFLGMLTAGFAFALAGGCPGRQMFMSGEGDNDAAIFVIGVFVGTAMAHNFLTASSPVGIGMFGAKGTIIGFAVCIFIAFYHMKKTN